MSGVGRRIAFCLGLLRPVLLGVLAQGCAVALMAVSAWLLSRAAEHPPVLYLMTTIVAVRALGIGRGVLRYQERLSSHDVALRLQSRLRLRAFDSLATGTGSRTRGDLLGRLITDIDTVQDLVVRVIVPIVSAAVVIIAGTTVIALISWPAGLLLLGGSALSGVAFPILTARLSARAARTRAPRRAEVADEIAVVARSRVELVAYGADRAAVDRMVAIDRRLGDAERRTAYVAGVANGAQWLSTGAVIIGSLLIGGRAVADGTLAPVLLAVLALTPLALHEVVAALPAALQAWQRCRSALRRVRELIMVSAAAIIGQDPVIGRGGMRHHDPAAAARITTQRLGVGWPSGTQLLDDIDLQVRPGERVALVGPTGVGKSTLAATLMGTIPARAGRIDVCGRIGYLAQDAHVFDTTVAENVRIGRRDATDPEVRTALDEVGLGAVSLDRRVGEFGGRISGGEARRLALARLLVADSTVLILDEPTEHLDGETAADIIDLIMKLRPNVAVLVISHDPELIAHCDRVVDLTSHSGVACVRPDRHHGDDRAAA